ncbi:MAG: O-antigen ligase family protein [Anaerolineales bacterium]
MNLSVGLLGICWVARWTRTGRLTRSTPIDVPILLFIISALVALWAAPSRPAGLVRLYLILAAVTVFYTLVNSDLKSLKSFSSIFIVFAGFMGIFLASQYDWAGSPTRFQLIAQTGEWLNRLIPRLALNLPDWNVLRNILASLLSLGLPLALLGFFAGRGQERLSRKIRELSSRDSLSVNRWVAGMSLALIIFALILTGSRTPWMVFGVILLLWLWWWLSENMHLQFPFSRIYTFLIGLGIALALVGLLVVRRPQLLMSITQVPGPKDYLNRAEIYPQSWLLAQETPYTGGGLAAFPALYSTYIRVIPFNAFLNEDTGNNAYLNLLVEQGWLGALSYTALLFVALGVAVWRYAWVKNEYRSFVLAGILGLGFVLLQGFAHATLVASRAIPALLIPAGLALSGLDRTRIGSNPSGSDSSWDIIHQVRSLSRPWKLTSVLFLVIIFATSLFANRNSLISIRNSLLSTWYADLGAVYMSRTELANFPSGAWDDGSQVAALTPAENLLQKALQLNPNNPTAHHRLGLIALLNRDFPTALAHLEKAHHLDPSHRGIRKSLGYTYVWTEQFDLARQMLAQIPEAPEELGVYVWWWTTQSRPDLSARAKEAALILENQ